MKNNILAIGAHPDDIEFGCSGTLAKHIANGDNVHVLVMTGTQSVDGTNDKVIRSMKQLYSEIDNALTAMGIDKCNNLGFTDLRVPFNLDSVSGIEKCIKQENIDTIYTHWEGDANQDHIATFQSTMAAARYVPNVYCYEQIPIKRQYLNQFNPNYYVDITDTMDVKINASNAHVSQIQKYNAVGLDVIENLTTLAKYRGIQAGTLYAEAFHIIKQVG